MEKRTQSGNVLFYILIATVLFGALGMALSHMMQGGEGNSLHQSEVSNLESSEVVQFGRALRSAAQAMQIDGVPDTQISFKGLDIVTGYTNASCTTESCDVFMKGGGGLSYTAPEAKWHSVGHESDPWLFTGGNAVAGVATGNADLVVILPYIKKILCLQINTLLGITNPAGDAPQITGTPDLTTKFTGAYAGTPAPIGGNAAIDGQRTGCFRGAGTPPVDTYHFYQVLLAR